MLRISYSYRPGCIYSPLLALPPLSTENVYKSPLSLFFGLVFLIAPKVLVVHWLEATFTKLEDMQALVLTV